MKVLVTGATGYIGSHVCKKLKEHGHIVVGIDSYFHGQYNDVSSYVDLMYKHDITTPRKYDEYDAVVHLAGRSIVPQSLKEPAEYYRVNTMGTATVIDGVETPNFIFASTSSAWEMKSPYARSKVAAEDIIRQKSNGHTIFRFFNVSGTDGEFRQLGNATHLIRRAAMAAAGKLTNLSIYGSDYNTVDGTCVRDYIHVIDVANSIVRAVENGPLNTDYECLGSKTGFSVLEVIDAMEKVTGKKIHKVFTDRREGDAESCIVDELSKYCVLTKNIEKMCLDQYNLEKTL